jgi:hypothetical protein
MTAMEDTHEQAPPGRPLVEPLPFLIVGGIGLIAIVAMVISLFRPLPIPAVISQDFMKVAGAVLNVDVTQADPVLLTTTLTDREPAVAGVRVPDLRPRGFSLLGGCTREVRGSPGVLAIYRNAAQELLVWQAYVGQLSDLPATTDVRDHGDRHYVVHRKASHILVFWQQGPHVQVITASLPAEQVVSLAYATEGAP